MNTDNFRAGARAMFDYILTCVANNYHPRAQAQCDAENKIALSWAKMALQEVSPEDADEWKSITEAQAEGYAAGYAAATKELSTDAEFGRIAIRFVDRAGDIHPGIDDAEAICADFHKAMSEPIDKRYKVWLQNQRDSQNKSS